MRRILVPGAFMLLLGGCVKGGKYESYPLNWVELRVRHRMYKNFEETHKVKLNEFFEISDTDYRGRVIRFIPDFAIDDSGRVFSKGLDPKNPAVLVEVWKKRKKIEETWAFREGLLPHFRASSMLSFEIVDFSIPQSKEKPKEQKPKEDVR